MSGKNTHGISMLTQYVDRRIVETHVAESVREIPLDGSFIFRFVMKFNSLSTVCKHVRSKWYICSIHLNSFIAIFTCWLLLACLLGNKFNLIGQYLNLQNCHLTYLYIAKKLSLVVTVKCNLMSLLQLWYPTLLLELI